MPTHFRSVTEPKTMTSPIRGRPANEAAHLAFQQVISLFKESEDEQITVTVLVDQMKNICGENAYGVQYTKNKLKEHFGDSVIITDINGKADVVTFRRTAASILHDFYSQGNVDKLIMLRPKK
ncbi:hypothetical protein DPMN_123151 [Dreissena polymorpha]|uniref:Uncharacterized protein n=1 Tax=Dreissena polymorpha TaxID=45954 RepID=A0A9D4GWV6_DREPO|nr:hypothetical protein DPMN_123151 [Dreissena polymorpha]